MKTQILGAGLALVMAISGWTEVLACGDKIFLAGLGVQYQQAFKAKVPGAIVIYSPPGLAGAPALRDVKLQNALRMAGHRLTVVRDPTELARLLASPGVDVVLADIGEAAAVGPARAARTVAPVVLPVMLKGSKSEIATCSAQYVCRLKGADKPEQFVTTVNNVMVERAKALKAARGN